MRLNNYISSTGICSRREADKLIQQKKVLINGKMAQVGQTVEPGDIVKVNGKKLIQKKNDVYIALNKPVGITCTTERHIKGNIIDYINYPERIFPVGRLDKPSEGLIILTNDGTIVNKILRSENNHEKEYVVTVNKNITQQFIDNMGNGVRIFNPVTNKHVVTNKCKITKVNNTTFKIILSQGFNRQIRRMCEVFGYEVKKLQRIRIMDLTLKGIAPGKWRKLTPDEVESLLK
ncbi:23S rRNA pseudouridine(2604) synthase RluF [Romboutsia sedimentorum]|uniref:Pseudouridine synthase n=1 Tax=Romboutsia sedimentorum TaxID=1368474 RepID=A0ABT7E505_9FIRM|nr:23S rRNA pseudouridine(2604) synthase RluF [Romboutsia sedimentorum]MDK2561957.1 23S rRNA pseudouridine(2604) synthase RluF [Romboutsia sedimentorum]MDK2586751.1 23S rRNA pseudouridine(2604) synthase RluF [Romboutsia sedimentorum]